MKVDSFLYPFFVQADRFKYTYSWLIEIAFAPSEAVWTFDKNGDDTTGTVKREFATCTFSIIFF
jgi:hypothetical protein